LVDTRPRTVEGLALLALGAFVTGLSGAVTPGPLLTGCIGEVARTGFVASLLLVGGHALTELVIIILVALRADVVARAHRARRTFAALGAVALMAMGALLLRDGLSSATQSPVQSVGDPSPLGPFLAGVALTLLNPYWIAWWATIGAGLTTQAALKGRGGVAAFFLGHEMADLVWYAFVGVIIASGRSLLTAAVYRGLLLVCAAAMFAIAAAFVAGLRRRPYPDRPGPEAGLAA